MIEFDQRICQIADSIVEHQYLVFCRELVRTEINAELKNELKQSLDFVHEHTVLEVRKTG